LLFNDVAAAAFVAVDDDAATGAEAAVEEVLARPSATLKSFEGSISTTDVETGLKT